MDCRGALGSQKSSPPPEIGGSSVCAARAQDLLPWPIKTRRRGSRSRPAAVGEPSNSTKSEKSRMESLDLMDLPLKKRICKEAAAVAASAESGGEGGAIHCFDLNKLPVPEDEQEILALPWYYRDENGAPVICS